MKLINYYLRFFVILILVIVVSCQKQTRCGFGQFIVSQGKCMECLSSCPVCKNLVQKCINCTQGLKMNAVTKICQPCGLGQKYCQQSKFECQNFYNIDNSSRTCKPECMVKNCQVCTSATSNLCESCQPNYKLQTDKKQCKQNRRFLQQESNLFDFSDVGVFADFPTTSLTNNTQTGTNMPVMQPIIDNITSILNNITNNILIPTIPSSITNTDVLNITNNNDNNITNNNIITPPPPPISAPVIIKPLDQIPTNNPPITIPTIAPITTDTNTNANTNADPFASFPTITPVPPITDTNTNTNADPFGSFPAIPPIPPMTDINNQPFIQPTTSIGSTNASSINISTNANSNNIAASQTPSISIPSQPITIIPNIVPNNTQNPLNTNQTNINIPIINTNTNTNINLNTIPINNVINTNTDNIILNTSTTTTTTTNTTTSDTSTIIAPISIPTTPDTNTTSSTTPPTKNITPSSSTPTTTPTTPSIAPSTTPSTASLINAIEAVSQMSNQLTTIIQKCHIGQVFINNTCQLCSKQCASCINTINQCLQCNNGYRKLGWKCITNETVKFNLQLLRGKNNQSKINQDIYAVKNDIVNNIMNVKQQPNQRSIVTLEQIKLTPNIANIIGYVDCQEVKCSLQQLQKRISNYLQSTKQLHNMKINSFKLMQNINGKDTNQLSRSYAPRTAPSASSPPTQNNQKKTSLAAILVPSILGVVLLGALISGFGVYYCRRNKKYCFKQKQLQQVSYPQNDMGRGMGSQRRLASKNAKTPSQQELDQIPDYMNQKQLHADEKVQQFSNINSDG